MKASIPQCPPGLQALQRACMTIIVALALLALTGCGDSSKPRDFNELIPRLMGSLKPTNPTQAAANLFNVTSPDERRDAIAFLQDQKYGHEPPYMRAYEILTTDPHPMVRAQAMRALGSSHNQSAVPYLIDGTTGRTGLADPEAEVRRDAAQGLLETFNLTAIDPLARLLTGPKMDPDDQVRIACARALVNAGTPAVLRALIDALDDKNAAVVYWARESLIARTGNKFDFDGKTWLTWYQQAYAPPATKPATE
jgi:HEAT repeat protein